MQQIKDLTARAERAEANLCALPDRQPEINSLKLRLDQQEEQLRLVEVDINTLGNRTVHARNGHHAGYKILQQFLDGFKQIRAIQLAAAGSICTAGESARSISDHLNRG